MRQTFILLRLLAALVSGLALTSMASAHGTNIAVTQVANRLVVSGGLADSLGYAPMIFVENDEDGVYVTEQSFSGFGFSTLWQIPGFNASGLAEGSGLYLDVLLRPYAHATPAEYRSLWYSDPLVEKVTTTPADHPLQIRKSASANVVVPTNGGNPSPLLMAAPTAADMGADKHFVLYLLRYDATDSIAPPVGAYGIFARLTSDVYAPSDPFLIVINNGIEDYPQMVPAALAINAAAFLPGDYNHDERVDAADYVVWRKSFGSSTSLAADGSYNGHVDEADFTVWRQNFGTVVSGSGSGISHSNVPEPNEWVLTVVGVAGYLLTLSLRGPRVVSNSYR